LAHLDQEIERVNRDRDALTSRLRLVETELERVSARKQRFDALQDISNAFDRLKELKADELFWEGVADAQQVAGHLERVRSRVSRFQQEINGILEQQSSLRTQINACVDELDVLYDEVREVHDREERYDDEYIVEREISLVPDRPVIMPWSREAESEKRLRKAVLVALLLTVVFSTLIPLLKVPAPVRPVVVMVPERLVRMLRKEAPKPEPPKEEKKPEKEKAPKEEQPKPTTQETQAARKTAENTGVLAYKESFKELIDEAPAGRLGAAARLSNQALAAGAARPGRSLVALPPSAGGSSGGISGVNRTIESDGGKRINAVDFTRVESKVADLKAETSQLGPGSSRTDEEIQLVFDKYKASLYRMYNTELRKDPSLRGRILLRITIDPSGEVSACAVQSSDLKSPDLVAQIVERVKRFNFGPKEKVSKATILYPIDFLPPS